MPSLFELMLETQLNNIPSCRDTSKPCLLEPMLLKQIDFNSGMAKYLITVIIQYG